MRVDSIELGVATGQRCWDRRDVEVGAGELEGGGCGVVGRKDAGAERGEGERFLYDDSFVGGREGFLRGCAFWGFGWGRDGGGSGLFPGCMGFSGGGVLGRIVLVK